MKNNWFLKFATTQILIDLEEYKKECLNYWWEIYQNSLKRNEIAKNFNFNINQVATILQQCGYPNSSIVINAFKNSDLETLTQEYLNISNWRSKNKLNTEQLNASFEINQMIRNIVNKLEPINFTENDVNQQINQLIQDTAKNMSTIKNNIEQAVNRIENWSSPLIIIKTQLSYDLNGKVDFSEASTNALIEFGNNEMAPNFSYFMFDGKIEIDDILESGDSDFFVSPKIQKDYFSLIQEIKNPGSTTRQGKKKTLYTARPIKDRHLYLNNKVPSNIFLTNSFNDAQSLIHDLPGSDKRRDIWKVIIDDKYLMMTFDSPLVKHYQVIGDGWINVYKLELIAPAE